MRGGRQEHSWVTLSPRGVPRRTSPDRYAVPGVPLLFGGGGEFGRFTEGQDAFFEQISPFVPMQVPFSEEKEKVCYCEVSAPHQTVGF